MHGAQPIGRGKSIFVLTLNWPVLAPGKYAVTLGIGTGLDPLEHSIECWAHNSILLESSSTEPIHGIFNVKISDFSVKRGDNG